MSLIRAVSCDDFESSRRFVASKVQKEERQLHIIAEASEWIEELQIEACSRHLRDSRCPYLLLPRLLFRPTQSAGLRRIRDTRGAPNPSYRHRAISR
jgi:hypothetical protein